MVRLDCPNRARCGGEVTFEVEVWTEGEPPRASQRIGIACVGRTCACHLTEPAWERLRWRAYQERAADGGRRGRAEPEP